MWPTPTGCSSNSPSTRPTCRRSTRLGATRLTKTSSAGWRVTTAATTTGAPGPPDGFERNGKTAAMVANFLAPSGNGPALLQRMRAGDDPVLAPGVYDGLGARLVEEAGFSCVYMTGFGTAASLLGRPDVGLLTLTEMAGNAARIVRATGLPVIADADTGYGNAINVIRTVQEYERAGVAGIHIEDQVS